VLAAMGLLLAFMPRSHRRHRRPTPRFSARARLDVLLDAASARDGSRRCRGGVGADSSRSHRCSRPPSPSARGVRHPAGGAPPSSSAARSSNRRPASRARRSGARSIPDPW
jgi:hypothetical protein